MKISKKVRTLILKLSGQVAALRLQLDELRLAFHKGPIFREIQKIGLSVAQEIQLSALQSRQFYKVFERNLINQSYSINFTLQDAKSKCDWRKYEFLDRKFGSVQKEACLKCETRQYLQEKDQRFDFVKSQEVKREPKFAGRIKVRSRGVQNCQNKCDLT